MPHSYEEIRDIALDALAGREETPYQLTQYNNLQSAVAHILARRGGQTTEFQRVALDRADAEVFLEVFWELFRQGIITLGLNDANREFPHFRVSSFGRRLLDTKHAYFFHDVSSYAAQIQSAVPQIHPVTLLYLQEAMQAFRSSCLLSATVMVGVAAEHTFLLMLETLEANPAKSGPYTNVFSQRTTLQKINKFKGVLDQNAAALPPEIKEDLETHFLGILSTVRTSRNQAGHPTGQIPSREDVYVLLQLFIPFCKKLYQLRDYFR